MITCLRLGPANVAQLDVGGRGLEGGVQGQVLQLLRGEGLVVVYKLPRNNSIPINIAHPTTRFVLTSERCN